MLLIHFVIGCIVGSFLYLTAERIPLKQSIFTPASHCTYCKKRLRYYELIPLLSIILQKFRCRSCNTKLSTLYFFSELIGGSLFSWSLSNGLNPLAIYRLSLLLMCLSLSLTDISYLIVEPKIFYSASLLICVGHLYFNFSFHWLTSISSFFILSLFNILEKENLGGGDILLLSFFGLLLGVQKLLFLLFLASSIALLFSFICIYMLKKKFHKLPFVPFLAVSLFFTLYFS